ncbi:BMP family lipoprotein [Halobacillus naozhouensis]|uniref:BMP family ABC transporter substrate-binding protein n=1 Tax=Halobacillus naozhouensis TaxID=554880 RepID=A0ABY8IYB3_9BACI|nr:BMP family ABC transporter substrate-binding protein [Halobacillus naozhouensis]WFT75242.1 BMP family ABC transporter substrate-binding protein [Halobacillus naozhouensis]
MKKHWVGLFILGILLLAGCAEHEAQSEDTDNEISAGLLVTESGLGDDSFSDSAFKGLEQARDELGITFDYREPFDKKYKKHMKDLINQGHDVIIGLGYNSQAAIDELAQEYPKQQFVLIDAVSEFDNVTSITFKEDEGSYLIGLIAGMRTESDVVGFIGGERIPVVERFETGFAKGVKKVNPDAEVLVQYAETFDDDAKGAEITEAMVEKGADFVFPAAGFTGIGALKEAQNQGIYAFGVDSDQFFVAEKAVVTSMLKYLDVALYDVMEQLVNGEQLEGSQITLGVKEKGVGLAPIRLIDLTDKQQAILDKEMGQ